VICTSSTNKHYWWWLFDLVHSQWAGDRQNRVKAVAPPIALLAFLVLRFILCTSLPIIQFFFYAYSLGVNVGLVLLFIQILGFRQPFHCVLMINTRLKVWTWFNLKNSEIFYSHHTAVTINHEHTFEGCQQEIVHIRLLCVSPIIITTLKYRMLGEGFYPWSFNRPKQ